MIRSHVIGVLFTALLSIPQSGCDPDDEFALEMEDEERIGNAKPLADAPPIVRESTIQLRTANDQFVCSAVLIRPDRALTARHCVDRNPSDYRIWFSADNSFSPADIRSIAFVRKHPTADVATLHLTADAPTRGGYRAALIHDPVAGSILPGDRVVTAGFGITGPGLADFGELRWGKMYFRRWLGSYESTEESYSSGLWFDAEAPWVNPQDPANAFNCPGDSGGPFYQWRAGVGWRVLAIQSTAGCGQPGGSIAADARALKAWILAD